MDRDLGDDNTQADVTEIFGLGNSGGSDIANEPNAVAESIASRHVE